MVPKFNGLVNRRGQKAVDGRIEPKELYSIGGYWEKF